MSKPIHRTIIQTIAHQCRGIADVALTSYNIVDEDWQAIKNCISALRIQTRHSDTGTRVEPTVTTSNEHR